MPDDEYGPEAEGLGFQPSLPRPNTQFLPSLLHLIVLFFLFPIVRLFSSKMSKDLRPSKFSKEFSNYNMFSIQNKDYIRYQNISEIYVMGGRLYYRITLILLPTQ